jgi:hypothetical protein
MMIDHPDLPAARTIADTLRARPGSADIVAFLDSAIARAEASGAQTVPVKVEISFQLDKYDGDRRPGQLPVQIMRGEG